MLPIEHSSSVLRMRNFHLRAFQMTWSFYCFCVSYLIILFTLFESPTANQSFQFQLGRRPWADLKRLCLRNQSRPSHLHHLQRQYSSLRWSKHLRLPLESCQSYVHQRLFPKMEPLSYLLLKDVCEVRWDHCTIHFDLRPRRRFISETKSCCSHCHTIFDSGTRTCYEIEDFDKTVTRDSLRVSQLLMLCQAR